jgi:toxin ParE1/3/4
MARYRLTQSAKNDIGSILRTSGKQYGRDARIRYSALLLAAMSRVAADPQGRSTADRSDVRSGVRSFHIRHSRGESREMRVADPVHVLFYRVTETGVVEIVRVLHEHMEPAGRLEIRFDVKP